MKKFTTILVLLLVLSVSTFAEGEIPAGGRSCPQGQTCLTEGQIPAGGKNCSENQQTCSTEGDVPIGGKSNNTIIENILDYLKSIFG